MKKILHTPIIILILLIACENQGSNNSGTKNLVHSAISEGMILEWNDEFDGDSLDRTKWEAPNNITRQGASHWMSDQVSVLDGNLILGITKTTDAPDVNYDCGAVRTKEAYWKDLFTQKYGYFEARMKLPKNIEADYWAAFWLMSGTVSDSQPDTQLGHEIDIMESFTIGDGYQHKLTMHWNGYNANHNLWSLDLGTHPELSNGEFHIYGLYWDENKFISYINNVEVGRTYFLGKGDNSGSKTLSNGPSQETAYIKLSCEASEWAGGSGWEDPLPDSDQFLVDYVRVYSGYKP